MGVKPKRGGGSAALLSHEEVAMHKTIDEDALSGLIRLFYARVRADA